MELALMQSQRRNRDGSNPRTRAISNKPNANNAIPSQSNMTGNSAPVPGIESSESSLVGSTELVSISFPSLLTLNQSVVITVFSSEPVPVQVSECQPGSRVFGKVAVSSTNPAAGTVPEAKVCGVERTTRSQSVSGLSPVAVNSTSAPATGAPVVAWRSSVTDVSVVRIVNDTSLYAELYVAVSAAVARTTQVPGVEKVTSPVDASTVHEVVPAFCTL